MMIAANGWTSAMRRARDYAEENAGYRYKVFGARYLNSWRYYVKSEPVTVIDHG